MITVSDTVRVRPALCKVHNLRNDMEGAVTRYNYVY